MEKERGLAVNAKVHENLMAPFVHAINAKWPVKDEDRAGDRAFAIGVTAAV